MIGIVIGTGPSLDIPAVRAMKGKALLVGVNNTFEDFDLDVWIACDPAWHALYGPVTGDFEKWHWDKGICEKYSYRHIEGVWLVNGKPYPRTEYITAPGPVGELWIKDKSKISLNHGSGPQALNLAVHYGCDPILLVGHDFKYEAGKPRHYFSDLSDVAGEYPEPLRKYSEFDKKGKDHDMLAIYKSIAEQDGLPEIINCTPDSALKWFPMGKITHEGFHRL